MAFTERKVENIAWDKINLEVVGKLLAIATETYQDGGKGLKYKVQPRGGGVVIMRGATDLNNKLHRDDIGCDISVTYLGEDMSREMSSNRSRPKMFKVLVDAERATNVIEPEHQYVANDSDIPF